MSVVALLCVCVCVCVACRTWAVTMASTQTQWRTAAECVWAMARAARRSISHLMRARALVSPTLGMSEQLEAN